MILWLYLQLYSVGINRNKLKDCKLEFLCSSRPPSVIRVLPDTILPPVSCQRCKDEKLHRTLPCQGRHGRGRAGCVSSVQRRHQYYFSSLAPAICSIISPSGVPEGALAPGLISRSFLHSARALSLSFISFKSTTPLLNRACS